MEKNIKLLDRDNCTGCMACLNICPVNAITVETDYEGFEYPKIDDTKCINCGKCHLSCLLPPPRSIIQKDTVQLQMIA